MTSKTAETFSPAGPDYGQLTDRILAREDLAGNTGLTNPSCDEPMVKVIPLFEIHMSQKLRDQLTQKFAAGIAATEDAESFEGLMEEIAEAQAESSPGVEWRSLRKR
jgi:hypothetical protein